METKGNKINLNKLFIELGKPIIEDNRFRTEEEQKEFEKNCLMEGCLQLEKYFIIEKPVSYFFGLIKSTKKESPLKTEEEVLNIILDSGLVNNEYHAKQALEVLAEGYCWSGASSHFSLEKHKNFKGEIRYKGKWLYLGDGDTL